MEWPYHSPVTGECRCSARVHEWKTSELWHFAHSGTYNLLVSLACSRAQLFEILWVTRGGHRLHGSGSRHAFQT